MSIKWGIRYIQYDQAETMYLYFPDSLVHGIHIINIYIVCGKLILDTMKRLGITGNHQNVFFHFHGSFRHNRDSTKRPIHTRQTDLFGQDVLALFQKSKLFYPYTTKPFLHGLPGSSCLKPSALSPLHCVRTEWMKVGRTGTYPAAMRGAERNDCLSGKIIILQKYR